jgi:hypothetical protein
VDRGQRGAGVRRGGAGNLALRAADDGSGGYGKAVKESHWLQGYMSYMGFRVTEVA